MNLQAPDDYKIRVKPFLVEHETQVFKLNRT
jgi:hypothetical protein